MRILLFLFSFLFSIAIAFGQNSADDLLGVWYTSDKKATILIFKYEGKYYGQPLTGPKINALDVNNPDPSKRNVKMKDIIFMRNFTWNSDKKKYVNGRTYNAENGKTYKSWIKLKDSNTLELHGYVGISLLGKSVYWTRKK